MRRGWPCTKDCPRRTPYCHNREVCPDWGKYEDADRANRAKAEAARKAGRDFSAVRHGAARRSEERKRNYERQKDAARRAAKAEG